MNAYTQPMLVEIIKAICSQTDTLKLLQTITEKAKDFFDFENTGIFIVNEQQDYHYDLTVSEPTIDGSLVNKLIQDNGINKLPHKGSPIEEDLLKISKANSPILVNFKKHYENYPDHLMLNISVPLGFEYSMAARLQANGKLIGAWYLNAKPHSVASPFSEIDFYTFQLMADALAVALANILANAELQQEKKQKEVLLQISESISAIQDRKELFATIFKIIQPIIPMDDTAIVVLNEDGSQWKDLSNTDHYHEAIASIKLHEAGYDGFNAMDEFIKCALNETGIITIDKLIADKQIFAPIMYEAGLKEFMYTPLSCQGKIIGALYFDSNYYGTYSPTYFPMFKAIAGIIAVAVNNILAKEEIVEREKEKSQLLEITELIAQVKDASDLLRLIVKKIQPIFNFHDCGLFVLSPDGSTHTDLAAVMPDVSPSEWNTKIASVSKSVKHEHSPLAWMMNRIAKEGKPILFDFKELVEKFPDYPQLDGTGILEMGYRDCLAFNLVVRGRVIGMFCINALQKNFFRQDQFAIFQSVAESVSIAVANIIANEELQERSMEKSFYLEVINELNKAAPWEEKFLTIAQLINSRIPCDVFSYSIRYNDGRRAGAGYRKNGDGVFQPNTMNQYLADMQIGIDDYLKLYGQAEEFFKGDRFFTTDQLQLEAAQWPLLKLSITAYQSQSLMFVTQPFNQGSILVTLNSGVTNGFNQQMLNFLKSVSDHVALSVENLLSQEEIKQRNKEKALQLGLNNTLINLKSTEHFTTSLAFEIDKLFQIDAFNLFIFRSNRKEILYRTVLHKKTDKGFTEQLSYLTAQSEFQWYEMELNLYDSNMPSGIYTDEAFEKFLAHKSIYQLIANTNQFKSLLLLSFPIGNNLSTCLVVWSVNSKFFNQVHLEVLENLKPQIALALDNLVAFQELARKELIKSQQVRLSNHIIQEKTSESLLTKIAISLNEELVHDLMVCIPTPQFNLPQFHGLTFKKEGAFAFENLHGRAEEIVLNALDNSNQIRKIYSSVSLQVGSKIKQLEKNEQALMRLLDKYAIQSLLIIPIFAHKKQLACLLLGSTKPFGLVETDIPILTEICEEIALTLENRYSTYQIEKLKKELEQENIYLQEEINTSYNFNEIIGESIIIKKLFEQISLVSPTDSTVLIEGETGTGKELIARAIHHLSPRRDKVLVKVNCATLPATLIESELFGHEKGAFTGAIDKRIGKFEFANGGTLFLDEVGELPLELQAKLLRCIQEKEIERLGSNRPIKVDVRIIAATNKNLFEETEKKTFRQDLYYRLNVFGVRIPPLRDRKEDILPLANHFVKNYSRKMGKRITRIADQTLQEMLAHDWPGNIRELEHFIENAVVLCRGKQLELAKPLRMSEPSRISLAEFSIKSLSDHEKEYIIQVLKRTNGKVRGLGGAAQLLDIHPSTLESRMKKLGIKKSFE